MHTKEKLLLLIFLPLFSCNSHDDSTNELDKKLAGHLSTNIVHNPRSLEGGSIKITTDVGSLQFADTLHDFGNLKENEQVTYEFSFENKGQSAVLIHSTKASCGCTIADYPKESIKPNDKGEIKVTFDSKGKKGYNRRAVIVTTNANPSVYELIIEANVE